MSKILVIEDDKNFFEKIKDWLVEYGYSVLPDDFMQMSNAIKPYEKGNICDFAIQQVQENYKDLKLILCDIKLRKDFRGGNKVVKKIRTIKGLNPFYLSMLPIIAITDHANREENIISDGADFPIEKDRFFAEPEVISAIIETQINKFENNLELLNIFKDNKKVFIVHGHTEAEEKVARFLERIELEPIILHGQPDEGDSIIEKIERLSNVGYAIILYTPCDLGMEKKDGIEPDLKDLLPRARQNVVFEHGYLTTKLGRENICVLLDDKVEKPGDIDGLIYIELDDKGAWKNKLADNMKSRGFDIDKNKI